MSKMTLSEELAWRGFVNQTTYKDPTALDGEPVTFYWGVDPSASSMTVGNLAMAMMVRHFISHGHKAVLLIGGATGMIGDPDGKADERNLKTIQEINANKTAITNQYKTIFAGQEFELVDNYDWFKDMGYLQFLREVGKHMPMSQMLQREFIQNRLGEQGSGISYAEFSYALIQGYDFVHLNREKGATLQVAGSDQWGNCIAGVDLIRRLTGNEAHIWTGPLVINKTTGEKFGKSEDGAIWLDEKLTSAYRFYQFWLNVDDEGVEDYLKIYTLLSKDEIDDLMAEFNVDRAARKAQKTLAYEVTKIVHGAAAENVRSISEVLFGSETVDIFSQSHWETLSAELPVVQVSDDLYQILVDAGLASSKSEARQFHASGAISVNGEKVLPDQVIAWRPKNLMKRGKNSFAIVNK